MVDFLVVICAIKEISNLNVHKMYVESIEGYDNFDPMKHFKFIAVYFLDCVCFSINDYACNMEFPNLVNHFNHFQAEIISKSSDLFELEKMSKQNM